MAAARVSADFLENISTDIAAIAQAYKDNPHFGKLDGTYNGKAWQLNYQLPCGHKRNFSIVYDNTTLGRHQHSSIGKFIQLFSPEAALLWINKSISTIPATRRHFIREIEENTLARILHGEKIFRADKTLYSVQDLWAPDELVYARNLPEGPRFRTFGTEDNEDTRCICAPKKHPAQPAATSTTLITKTTSSLHMKCTPCAWLAAVAIVLLATLAIFAFLPPQKGVLSKDELVQNLSQNATVELSALGNGDDMLKGEKYKLTVNNEYVQVWEYRNERSAKNDAERIGDDGSQVKVNCCSFAIYDWIAPPHFYQKGRIIVLYNGESNSTIALLESVLGQQFSPR